MTRRVDPEAYVICGMRSIQTPGFMTVLKCRLPKGHPGRHENGELSWELAEADEVKPFRVYICGSHSTGKTTLARWIARTYGLPLVNEVARAVLSERETSFAQLRSDLDAVGDYQEEVFRRQREAEDKAGVRFVSDRAWDNLAYAASHTLRLKKIASGLGDYVERLRKDAVVFLVRPHPALLVEDGVRERVGGDDGWNEAVRIDGMVRLLLELHDVDYVTISGLSLAERARTVRAVLRVAGLRREE